LREDPSLRATVPGRALLRLLSMHALGTAAIDELARAVPNHRRGLIADLARQVAETWLRLAGQIDGCESDETALSPPTRRRG
jgi:hypothetical protein